MKDLQLSLKKNWFEMTKSGIKTEDYREINPYWFKRLFNDPDKEMISEMIEKIKLGWSIISIGDYFLHYPKKFQSNIMTLGYPKSTDTSRIIKLEHKGIEIEKGNPAWGAEPDTYYFVIKHGLML